MESSVTNLIDQSVPAVEFSASPNLGGQNTKQVDERSPVMVFVLLLNNQGHLI